MALNPVTIMEMLRPWRDAGINHLYMPEGFDLDAALAQKAAQASSAGGQPQTAAQPSTQAPETRPQQRVAQSTAQAPHVPSPPAPTRTGLTAFFTVEEHTDVTQWPHQWQQLYAKTRPAPLLWTYTELGEDFFGKPSESRSQLLRKLVGTLRLPKGSSLFWPHSAPGEDQKLEPCPHIFTGAIKRFDPQILVILGEDSVCQLGCALQLKVPFTQQIGQGRLFVLLPSLAALQKQANLFDQTIVFLNSILQSKMQLLTPKD